MITLGDYFRFPEEEKNSAELRVVKGLLEAVPSLEGHLDPAVSDPEEWSVGCGMIFMDHLWPVLERLAENPADEALLRNVFQYFEGLVERLETESWKGPLPDIDRVACDFLLFTFTDNPTGHDPKFAKLAPYMGPKILKMCTIQ